MSSSSSYFLILYFFLHRKALSQMIAFEQDYVSIYKHSLNKKGKLTDMK